MGPHYLLFIFGPEQTSDVVPWFSDFGGDGVTPKRKLMDRKQKTVGAPISKLPSPETDVQAFEIVT